MKHMGRTSKSDAMRIATWNVNSIKQRLDHLATFVKSADPDVVCLQELKCVDEAFPRADVEALGYNVVTHGQKAYNGVAILSKRPLEDVRRGLPGDEGDEQARYLEGVVSTATGAVRVASIYLPNGNPIGTPKFDYKLAWMDRLRAHARGLLLLEEPLVLCGDYNVIPEPKDAMDPAAWTNDALFQPESRSKFRELAQSRLHRRGARLQRPAGPLLVLGLPGRRLPAKQRHPHRPPAALAPGAGQAEDDLDPQRSARLGQAVRPRAGDRRSGYRLIAKTTLRHHPSSLRRGARVLERRRATSSG